MEIQEASIFLTRRDAAVCSSLLQRVIGRRTTKLLPTTNILASAYNCPINGQLPRTHLLTLRLLSQAPRDEDSCQTHRVRTLTINICVPEYDSRCVSVIAIPAGCSFNVRRRSTTTPTTLNQHGQQRSGSFCAQRKHKCSRWAAKEESKSSQALPQPTRLRIVFCVLNGFELDPCHAFGSSITDHKSATG